MLTVPQQITFIILWTHYTGLERHFWASDKMMVEKMEKLSR